MSSHGFRCGWPKKKGDTPRELICWRQGCGPRVLASAYNAGCEARYPWAHDFTRPTGDRRRASVGAAIIINRDMNVESGYNGIVSLVNHLSGYARFSMHLTQKLRRKERSIASPYPTLLQVLAGNVKLGRAVGIVHAPVGLVSVLAVVAGAVGLPWLVKGLKVEDVDAPGEQRADALVVEALGVLVAGLGVAVVGSASCRGQYYITIELRLQRNLLVGQPVSPVAM